MSNEKPGWVQWKPKRQELPQDWDVIVIGSGLGGLMAAAKLATAGKRCLVIEQHYVAGGYAHHFPRKEKDTMYYFDVALHQTGLLRQGSSQYQVFEEIGINDKLEYVETPSLHRSIFPRHDLDITVPSDPEAYRLLLHEKFPAEAEGIDKFFEIMREIPRELPKLLRAQTDPSINAAEEAPNSMRYMMAPLNAVFDDTVSDPLLRALLAQLWPYLGLPPGEMSAIYFALMWHSYTEGGFYIRGGGQALSNAMCERIEDQDGAILLRRLVEEILVEDGRVAGVRTHKGETFHAPVVISNASPITTFGQMLDKAHTPDDVLDQVNTIPISTSIIQAYVGIRGDAAELGLPEHEIFVNRTLNADEEWEAVKRGEWDDMSVLLANHSSVNADACPKDKSVLEAAILAMGEHWIDLPEAEYKAKKEKVTEFLIDRIAEFIPDVRDRIEVVEVGTPKTMKDYSLSPNGAVYGYAVGATTHTVFRPGQRTHLPGLYLAGAWTFPGAGFGGALRSGYTAAQLILADAKKLAAASA